MRRPGPERAGLMPPEAGPARRAGTGCAMRWAGWKTLGHDIVHLPATHAVWYEPISSVRCRLNAASPCFVCSELPAGCEPHRQWRPRPIKDSACRHRGPAAVIPAHEPTVAQSPTTNAAALRTGEVRWPSQPLRIIQAIRISVGPCRESVQEPGVMLTSFRSLYSPAYGRRQLSEELGADYWR